MKTRFSKLKSRKLWITIASQVVILLAEAIGFDLSMEAVVGIVGAGVGYITNEALIDRDRIKAEAKKL